MSVRPWMMPQRDRATLSPQAEARRESILAAALEIMSRKGYHRTSIADIAARARVSRAAVYQYFGDKRDILAAIADRVERLITGAIDAWAPLPISDRPRTAVEPSALIEQLRRMIDARASQVVVAIAANADAARLVLRQARGVDRQADDALRRIDAHIVGVLGQDVQTAIEHGWARPCDAPTIARYLLGGVQKLLMDALDPEHPLELNDSVVREIGALVFFGLAHPDLLARVAQTQRAPPDDRRQHAAHRDEEAKHPPKPERQREEST
jgi:AcrR family transcriptional regulator